MEKAVFIALTIINCVVAVIVISLILTDRKTHHSTRRKCHVTYNSTGVFVNCVGLWLSSVPKPLPQNTTKIDFKRNDLVNITNNSFGCLDQLRILDLYSNSIEYIEAGSFHGLPKLSVLILSENRLNFSYKSLPIGLFSNLKYLKQLEIDETTIHSNWSYPEMTFRDLTNLESLKLSAPPILHFGISFSKMIHLKELFLTMSNGSITRDSFSAFSHLHLKTLEIDRYDIENSIQVDNMSFSHFHELQAITLRYLDICLSSTLESLKVFAGKNMSLISLKGRYRFRYFDKHARKCNSVVSPYDTKHLVSVCVEKVKLTYYGIGTIQRGTFDQEPFSKCVKFLDLRENCIVANKDLYLEFQSLLNLEYLNIEMGSCVKRIDMESGNNCPSNESTISLQDTSECSDYAWNDVTTGLELLCHGRVLNVSVPRKLKTLIMSNLFQGVSMQLCTIRVHGAQNLQHLDVSHWKLRPLNSKVLGVTNLTSVDYTGNDLESADGFLFNDSPNIKSLILADNIHFLRTFFTPTFNGLLSAFRKLRYLSLSYSGIEEFPFNPQDMFTLSTIDLSINKIKTLRSEVRDGLDQRVSDGHGLTLDLQGNIFNCACNDLRFVAWLIETDVKLTSWRIYTCTNEDGELENLSAFAASYMKHWRKCFSKLWLAFTISISFLIITLIVTGMMIDKYSLRLKCIFLKWFGLRFQVPKREDFLYDIFVYYSSKDDHTWVCNTFRQKMEEERGLRLCIPDRDFVPGSCTAEEILEAIHKSWKTVVYMTEVFLEDELCAFTLSSAVYASTNEMPNRLILLYSNEIFNKPLPPIVTQLLDGDDNFMLEELEELDQWDILYRKALCWV